MGSMHQRAGGVRKDCMLGFLLELYLRVGPAEKRVEGCFHGTNSLASEHITPDSMELLGYLDGSWEVPKSQKRAIS